MKRIHLWLAFALLIVVNTVILAGIARNRAGSPDAELTLTERELVLQTGNFREENSGLALLLDWKNDFVAEWFDTDKLAELGFDVTPWKGDEAESDYRGWRTLPKKAFIVLEYEGKAWERFQRKKDEELASLREPPPRNEAEEKHAESERARIENELLAGSRLFAVDVGLDPRNLRALYPDGDRYIILPALVRIYPQREKTEWNLRGNFETVLGGSLHIPRDLAAPLMTLPNRGRLTRGYDYFEPGKVPAPRYRVTVRWGRRYEPWVVGVRLIGGE